MEKNIKVYGVNNTDINYCSISRLYATGQAEDFLGYDIVCFNKEDFDYLISVTLEKGKYVFEGCLYDKENNKKPCLIYLWQEKHKSPAVNSVNNGFLTEKYYSGFLGLIIMKGDNSSIDRAAISFYKESQII